MAIRKILDVAEHEETLSKKCRAVEKFDSRLDDLLDDMIETMQEADGAGLAAPQVGVLRRVAVVDVGDGVIELVNPVIVESEGEEDSVEGCLSVPGKYGYVIRPYRVKVKAQNRKGEHFEMVGEGFKARAFCHEIDHLDGIVFTKFIHADYEQDEEE